VLVQLAQPESEWKSEQHTADPQKVHIISDWFFEAKSLEIFSAERDQRIQSRREQKKQQR
jgi:hypothetical protein